MVEEEEKRIPVFTVLKNGWILKNIFVINKPPPSVLDAGPESIDQENEEILIVGRHPDCNIMLTHPSISRFHLQINSNPSLQKLSVKDLSSVHGTWISEKKVEPGVRVEMNEDDTIRVGGSSRVYRLHWVPLSRAYDLENPFVSRLDMRMAEEKDEDTATLGEENYGELYQDENSLEERNTLELDGIPVGTCQDGNSLSAEKKEIESLDLILEMGSSFVAENSEFIVKKEIPSAPPMAENIKFCDGEEKDGCSGNYQGQKQSLSEILQTQTGDQKSDEENQSLQQALVTTGVVFDAENTENSLRRFEERVHMLVKLESLTSVDEVEDTIVAEILESEIQGSLRNQHEERITMGNLDSLFSVEEVEEHHGAEILEDTDIQGSLRNQHEESITMVNLDSLISVDEVEDHPMTETLKETEIQGLLRNQHEENITLVNLDSLISVDEVEDHTVTETFEEMENQGLLRNQNENMNTIGILSWPPMTESVNSLSSVGELLTVIETEFEQENQPSKSILVCQSQSEGVDLENPKTEDENYLPENSNCSSSDEECFHPSAERLEETENGSISRKGFEKEKSSCCPDPLRIGSVCSSQPADDVILEITDQQFNKENQTPIAPCSADGLLESENVHSPTVRSEKTSSMPSIWSRRGKPPSVLQVQTGRDRGKTVDMGLGLQNEENVINTSILKAPFSSLSDEEFFTPDKENFTPNTLLLKSMKKKGLLEEAKRSKLKKSSRVTLSPNVNPEQDTFSPSDKENQTPKVLQEQKSARLTPENRVRLEQEMMTMKRRAERLPFQSLVVNSAGKSNSEVLVHNSSMRSSNSVSHIQMTEKKDNTVGDGKRNWNMLVDTSTLLDKESMKSLQLLQGLKGTHLVIPRLVIRELDCLNRCGSLFRRTSEVTPVLEWIEESMTKTKEWIHVQSSVDEGMPVAPTPRNLVQSSAEERSTTDCPTSSSPFAAHGGRMEIVSPTAEDHIVECALLFRKMRKDGQLIILSNDITLKIKAMAEGLICETAKEFRESLVNPFSERFLWTDSYPRGRTWSYVDDVVLREKYCRFPSKKSSKGEGAKGLKLILLYNSHYGKITSAT